MKRDTFQPCPLWRKGEYRWDFRGVVKAMEQTPSGPRRTKYVEVERSEKPFTTNGPVIVGFLECEVEPAVGEMKGASIGLFADAGIGIRQIVRAAAFRMREFLKQHGQRARNVRVIAAQQP